MPLVGHLAELRERLIWSILAVVVGTASGSLRGPLIIDADRAAAARTSRSSLEHRRRLRDPAPDRARRRGHPGDAGPAVPPVAVRGARADAEPSAGRSCPGSRPRSLFFALGVGIAYVILPFARRSCSLPDDGVEADAHGRRVLRLPDDAVPGLRRPDGVPDPAGRAVAGRGSSRPRGCAVAPRS